MTRVFITGMGALTPIGNDAETFWRNLLAGKSGAGKITSFETTDMPYNMVCAVKDFDPHDYMAHETAASLHRSAQFAVAVTKQALADARFVVDNENADRVGILISTGGGGINSMEDTAMAMAEHGWDSADVGPYTLTNALPNTVSCSASIASGARGPVMTSTVACASGHYSLIEAFHFLRRGEADVIVAGGVESSLSILTMAAFGRMGPLSSRTDDPEHACRPFSIDRDGFVASEGAAAFVLETEEHARRRGARLLAEVLGGKLTGDAFHITAPDPNGAGAARALRGAVEMANLTPDQIDVVYAHGTGTTLNDISEAKALKLAFGQAAYAMKITSIKSMVGHAMGAAGAESVVAAVKTLNTGLVPPTINYTPDPEIDLHIVGNQAEQVTVRHLLVNAFGFGGQNVVAVLGRAPNN